MSKHLLSDHWMKALYSPLSPVDSVRTKPLGEFPPAGFGIQPKYVGTTIFSKYDAWVALTRYMGNAALEPWEMRVEFVRFTDQPRVGISMIGNNKPEDPPMLNKHFIWSMVNVIAWWESQEGGRYASTKYGVLIGDERYGFGQIFGTVVGEENMVSPPNEVTTSKIRRRDMAIDPKTDSPATRSITTMPDGSREITDRPSGGTSASNADEVKLKVHYREDPKAPILCPGVEFYLMLMRMLMDVAQHDAESSYPYRKLYDQDNDFSFEIGARTPQAGEAGEFLTKMAIHGVQAMATLMADEDPTKRFKEFYAQIFWNKRMVGQMSMYKGRIPGGGPSL